MVGPTVIVSVAPDRSGNFVCDATVEAHDVTIQRAIDHVSALNGGSVFLRNGTYNITAAVQILVGGISFIGSGFGTIPYLVDGSNCNVIEVGDGATAFGEIIISNLKIHGNKAGQGAESNGILIHGASGIIVSWVHISDVYIYQMRDRGIYAWYSHSGIFTDNIINGCDSFAVWLRAADGS